MQIAQNGMVYFERFLKFVGFENVENGRNRFDMIAFMPA